MTQMCLILRKIKVSSPPAPYIQDADAVTSAFARIQHKPTFIVGNLRYVTTNAHPAAPVAAPVAGDEPSYPVLLYLEGASGFRQMSTFQVEELVSHGYIVLALDQPYTAAAVVFPNGRQATMPSLETVRPMIRASYIPPEQTPTLNGRSLQGGTIIPYLAHDVSVALDQLTLLNQADPNGILTGRLDMKRVGSFGVSLGGIVVSKACQSDLRLGACLMMDAPVPTDVVRAGLRQPSMWITRDEEDMRLERQRAGGWSEEEIHTHLTSMRAAYDGLTGAGYFVRVTGTFHSNFTDVPNWSPLASWLGLTGPIDGQRAHSIINAYSLAFFDRHLKGLAMALLDGPAERYPEVRFESRTS